MSEMRDFWAKGDAVPVVHNNDDFLRFVMRVWFHSGAIVPPLMISFRSWSPIWR